MQCADRVGPRSRHFVDLTVAEFDRFAVLAGRELISARKHRHLVENRPRSGGGSFRRRRPGRGLAMGDEVGCLAGAMQDQAVRRQGRKRPRHPVTVRQSVRSFERSRHQFRTVEDIDAGRTQRAQQIYHEHARRRLGRGRGHGRVHRKEPYAKPGRVFTQFQHEHPAVQFRDP